MSQDLQSHEAPDESTQERQRIVAANEALIISAVRMHELIEAAETLNAQLRQEISVRKLAEQKFRGLLESAPDAMIITDRDGKITLVNGQTYKLFGYASGDLLGQPIEVLIPARYRRSHPGHRHSFVVNPNARPMGSALKLFALRKDGTEFPVEISLSPMETDAGYLVIAAVRDITERRKLEEALAARAEELARADRSKDEFLALLGHELRNPLAPIHHSAELLRSSDASPEEREQAHIILCRQIQNMSRMIDDLLDISRIKEGKIELRRQIISIHAVLSAAANLARPSIEARSQNLTVVLPTEPISLEGDATRLEQVFGNLLTNACKYSNPGSHIQLIAERGPSGNDPPQVIVRVRDDGIGIAPEFLPRVFDLFAQASHLADRAKGGMGIGLSLVKRLVELHGGTVEAHSEGLGHGSEFLVRLPRLDGVVPPLPPSAPPVREIPRRILVVDDNEDSARSMCVLQRRRGHDARAAFTGIEALAIAAEFVPEIVLLDISLPGMDGHEVARRLRSMPSGADALLVAMTGYGGEKDRQEAMDAGFDQFMVKPADLELLREWMRRGRN